MTETNLNLNKNTTGRYGEYGGQYIPETLMNELDRMAKATSISKTTQNLRPNCTTYW